MNGAKRLIQFHAATFYTGETQKQKIKERKKKQIYFMKQ